MRGMCLQQKFISHMKVHGNDVLNQQSAEKCVCRYNQMNRYGGCESTPDRKVWKTQFSNTEELRVSELQYNFSLSSRMVDRIIQGSELQTTRA
jgi:hypothetical protein